MQSYQTETRSLEPQFAGLKFAARTVGRRNQNHVGLTPLSNSSRGSSQEHMHEAMGAGAHTTTGSLQRTRAFKRNALFKMHE